MTPEPAAAPPRQRVPPSIALVAGVVLGAFGGAVLAGGVRYAMVKQREAEVRRGWNLVPVVVAGSELPAQKTLTMEDIHQRSVPEQFVTSSVVKPDSASYIIGQTLRRALPAGQPIRWDDVLTTRRECIETAQYTARRLDSGPTPAVWQVVGALKRKLPEGGAAP